MASTATSVDQASRSATGGENSLLPGLALVAGATVLSVVVNRLVPSISTLVVAIGLGVLIANTGSATALTSPAATSAGLRFARQHFLRAGVVLLGLRLSLTQITELGVTTIAIIVATVTATFFGTQAVGRRLGLSPDLSLLVATGYSICGASAIAAVQGSLAQRPRSNGTGEPDSGEPDDGDQDGGDEVAVAVGLVTLCGTLAMFLLPPLAVAMGLSEQQFGTWIGASIHDVAQVVAAGSAGGSSVLAVAVVVKLTRVSLLAPIVAGVNVTQRHKEVAGKAVGGKALSSRAVGTPARPPVVPLFVVGFLAMVLVRTTGWVPTEALDQARLLEGLLLTAALVGLGAGVKAAALRRLGAAPLILGAVAWAIVALVSLVGVLVTG